MEDYNIGDLVKINRKQNKHAVPLRSLIGVILAKSSDWAEPRYAIYIHRRGYSAWHPHSTIKKVCSDSNHLMDRWKMKEKKLSDKHIDINWIFANSEKFVHPESVSHLQTWLGIPEGSFTDYNTSITIFDAFENDDLVEKLIAPFIAKNDKQGWTTLAKAIGDIEWGVESGIKAWRDKVLLWVASNK